MSSLVDVFIYRSDWFGPFSLEKEQRAVNLVIEEKRTASLPGEHLENLSQPPNVVETIFPHTLRFFLSLSQGLLSTKHNTNVCFVRPQFKGPYLFQ